MAREMEPDVNEGAIPVEAPERQRLYDYYVPPPKPTPSPLHEVAQALAPLSDSLMGLAQQQQAQQNKADAAQGEADFWNQNASGNAEALNNGSLPAQHSKPYMDAYASQAGLNDALRLGQSIGPDYSLLDKTATDPAGFDKWFMQHASGSANANLKDNPGYAKAYGQGIARLHAQLSERYTQDRSQAIKAGAQQEFSAAVGNTVDFDTPVGPSQNGDPLGVDIPRLADNLTQVRQMSLQGGMDKAYVDQSTVDTVVTKAIANRNPQLLNVLGQLTQNPNDPNSAKLADTEYGSKQILAAQSTIKTSTYQDRERWQAQSKYVDEQASKDAQRQVVQGYVADPNFVPTPAQVSTISKTDPLFPSKLAKIREGIITGQEKVEDPAAVSALFSRWAQSGMKPEDITNAMATGVISKPETLKSAYEWMNTLEKYNQSGGANRITDDAGFKQYVGQIVGLTGDPHWAAALGGPKTTKAGQDAINDFTLAAMQHAIANPNEGPIERRRFIDQLGEGIVKGISNPQAEDFHEHTYTRPGEIQSLMPGPQAPIAPQQPSAAPGAAQAASPVQPQQVPNGNAPAGSSGAPGQQGNLAPAELIGNPDQARQALMQTQTPPQWARVQGMMTPEFRAAVETMAQTKGMQPQQVIDQMWHESRQPGGAAPAQAAPQQHGSLQLPPEIMEHLHKLAAYLNPVGTAKAAEAPGGGVAAGTANPTRVAQIDASPVGGLADRVARETGFPPNLLKAMVSIESGGRANAGTGSYHGLLQLSKEEFAQHGGHGDINDPEQNLRAGVASLKEKAEKFAGQFGRQPTASELYLMHQQGEAGLRAHEAHPEAPAWQNMASTAEGRQKGERWAKAAIWGNLPSDMRHLFGSVENVTSADFMAVWMHKVEGIPFATALRQVHSHSQLADAE